MLNKYDYLYNGEESLLILINPVIKLFGLFIYILLILLKFDRLLFIINIGLVFLLILLSNVKLTKYLKIIWKLKYPIILLYAYLYYKNLEIVEINIIIFKLIFLLMYIWVIIYTTNKEELSRGLSIILNKINLIGIPIKKITMFFINVYSFIEYFIDTYNEYINKIEREGKVFLDSNIFNKLVIFFKNFKIIWQISYRKLKLRKKDLKYRLFDTKEVSKYKYRRRLCLFDYLYVLINIGMIVYYILKVR